MYTKQDLIENKKLEKIIRENKYRTRKQIKPKKTLKDKINEDLFLLIILIPLTIIEYQVLLKVFFK